VLTVKGLVGLVDEGMTLGGRTLDDVGCMPAARALRMKGVDGASADRRHRVLDEAGFVQRVGVDHHLHVEVVGDGNAAIDGRGRGPQSSWSFRAQAPASTISTKAPGKEALPLPERPMFIGNPSSA
jgi:hypothetical protein